MVAVPSSEKSLIRHIRELAKAKAVRPLRAGRQSTVALGIGDDTAILQVPVGHEVLITTDFSLEGVHFRRDWHPADSVGHRCLARGLSDIAAMGGTPVAAFLSLALPAKLPRAWVEGFLHGLLALAGEHGVTLAGGDTAQAPGGAEGKILADIVVVGSAPRGEAVRRSGARAGDAIYVTGRLGASAVVLDRLYRKENKSLNTKQHAEHFYPSPRVAVGRYLREKGISRAMIDLSDGLSTDLHHLCEESRLGAMVYEDRIPVARGATLKQALHGGEDYELLFTASPKRAVPAMIEGAPVTRIGEMQRSSAGVMIASGTGKSSRLQPLGWEHFTSRKR